MIHLLSFFRLKSLVKGEIIVLVTLSAKFMELYAKKNIAPSNMNQSMLFRVKSMPKPKKPDKKGKKPNITDVKTIFRKY